MTSSAGNQDERDRRLAELEREVDRLRCELAHVREEYQQFIYIVSHDLNAPPRKMLAFASRLTDRLAEDLDDKARHYLDRINANARVLQQQMDALLRVSRCRPSGMADAVAEVDLKALLDELAGEFSERLRGMGGELLIAECLPSVQGNRKQLQQLFRELLSNALRFASPERTLRVQVSCSEQDQQRCVIDVTDNGIGFDNRYRDSMFQIFQRLHVTAADAGTPGGVGAGLAVAQKAAETHGGSISADGRPGEGALFRVELSRRYPHELVPPAG